MSYPLQSWLFGLSVSIVLGGVVAWIFLSLLRRYLGISKEKTSDKRVPPWLTGATERLFFTCVIAFQLGGAAIAMIGWLTLKMVTNWNRPSPNSADKTTGALSALLTGLVSMMFAMIGGLIVRGAIFGA